MSQVNSSRHDRLEAMIGALLDPALEPIVDMVVTRDGSGYEARALDGAVRFRRDPDDAGRHYTEVHVEGRNPLGDTATDRFPTLAAERAAPWPTRTQQSYPYAHDQIAQLYDHPAAPDIVCLHTAAHNWEDHGGERGEHGSLGIVQVRAPFVLAGAGVVQLGFVPGACRLVDVAPTSSPSSARRHATAADCSPARTAGSWATSSTTKHRRRNTWWASSGTAATPTSSTTSWPGATHPSWPGLSTGAP